MLTEFSARQCEKSNDIDLNTEYSKQFGSLHSKETDQQVHFQYSISLKAYVWIHFSSLFLIN